jgi:phosphoenolpyruvate synthase/pyruvate phosphate dikinase
MKQHKYKKVFTRDQALTTEESWHFAHEEGIERWYDGKRLNYPPLISYMLDGAIEEWHSIEQYQWIKDTLQKQIKKNKNIVHEAILKYEKKMGKVRPVWTRDSLDTISQLEKFINDFYTTIPYFPVWYYAGLDERTPKRIREEAMDVRRHDLFYDECDRIVRNTFRKLFPKLIGFETVILKDEIRHVPDIKILQKRKENFVLIPGHAAEIITIEEYLKTHPEIILIEEISKYDQKSGEIKGQIAYKGNVRGKVKVIRRLDQMDKIKKGDILVSPMTSPNFLQAMKKAVAFITDEGGITCHAAIVAREMKKPCLIGTKIATKVFKDGDLVEVDANKGIVKILKKK